jgi:hypothetical protein
LGKSSVAADLASAVHDDLVNLGTWAQFRADVERSMVGFVRFRPLPLAWRRGMERNRTIFGFAFGERALRLAALKHGIEIV